jgi:hypothetical protein
MIVVRLLGLSRDGLNSDGIIQEIGLHLNLHHSQCYSFLLLLSSMFSLHIYVTFQFFPLCNVRFVVHLF